MQRIRQILVGVAVAMLLAVPIGAGLHARSHPPEAGATLLVLAEEAHGSGVHIGGGLVLTAHHVVAGAARLAIRTDDGRVLDPELLWSNAKYDIALLRIAAERIAADPLRCAEPVPGEAVSAVGNPFAIEFAVFFGHVSGTARPMGDWARVVPLDLTVAPGMSGGPLLDRAGRVVGIIVATLRAAPIGAAVPASVVCGLMGRGI